MNRRDWIDTCLGWALVGLTASAAVFFLSLAFYFFENVEPGETTVSVNVCTPQDMAEV